MQKTDARAGSLAAQLAFMSSVGDVVKTGMTTEQQKSALAKILGLSRKPQRAMRPSLIDQLTAAATVQERTDIYNKARELYTQGLMSLKSFNKIKDAFNRVG